MKQTTAAGSGQRALPLLLFHDNRSFPIGVAEKWTHTPDGLDGMWKLNDDPEAQRAARAAERGELTGLSIGFQPMRSRWEFVGWDDYNPDDGPDHMDRVYPTCRACWKCRSRRPRRSPTPRSRWSATPAPSATTGVPGRAARAAAGGGVRSLAGPRRRVTVRTALDRGRPAPRPVPTRAPARQRQSVRSGVSHPCRAVRFPHLTAAPDVTTRRCVDEPCPRNPVRTNAPTWSASMDSTLAQVAERDNHELVQAERELLEKAETKLGELDAQIEPALAWDKRVAAHADTSAGLPRNGDRLPAQPRRADGGDRAPAYATPGAFVVDLLRARGITDRGVVDPEAADRVAQTRVVADQKTSDTTGILPTPIVGPVVNLIDANRPLISIARGREAVGRHPRRDVHPPEDHATHHRRRPGGRENPAVVPEDDDHAGVVHEGDLWRHRRHFPAGHRLDVSRRRGTS